MCSAVSSCHRLRLRIHKTERACPARNIACMRTDHHLSQPKPTKRHFLPKTLHLIFGFFISRKIQSKMFIQSEGMPYGLSNFALSQLSNSDEEISRPISVHRPDCHLAGFRVSWVIYKKCIYFHIVHQLAASHKIVSTRTTALSFTGTLSSLYFSKQCRVIPL